ncbi:hypothetical protein H310_03537 [Aphanomyces invadans]|uniref:Uncharacterized protein n=1 Tax=Aphanomyces invadans TaxID=157072 RepID=A0A024UHX8_9STRA|nr:hypothetical protein H310_03537 [Aphanomyces invadans]ETW05884.1 hypothetical protein H310_03537 [Aphanomyces invadans]|eukprot:XP_008865661.1 hypothetical protein H310_03537 [Aphanomyces invadans]
MRMQVDDAEWRSPEDAVVYDSLLLRSVFTRLRRQSANDGILELDLFSKQQVVDELELHEGKKLLRRRPNLRKLHTRLSSLTNIQESISLDAFRMARVRDKTISFDVANELLHELCRSQLEAEAERKRGLAVAYKPMWCTRNNKLADNHLATTYNVGCKPPHTLTSREKLLLERRVQCTHDKAKVVAQLFVQTLMQTLFPPREVRGLPGRPSTAANPCDDARMRSKTPPATAKLKKMTPALARKTSIASPAQEQQQIANLRMRVLCPGYDPDNASQWRNVIGSGGAFDNATDAEVFVTAVECAGEPSMAQKLWAQPHFRSAVSLCCTRDPATKATLGGGDSFRSASTQDATTTVLLDAYRTWLTTYRTKAMSR